MYKVYAQNKVILFTNSQTKDERYKTIDFTTKEGLLEAYSTFLGLADEGLNVVAEDVEKVWETFESLHTIIEAAGGVVKNKEGNILTIFRNGKWDLPKGKVDEGEEVNDAAIREVAEECGVKGLSIVKPALLTYHVYDLNGQQILKPTYWYEMTCSDESELVPQTEEGITEVKWMEWQEINDVLFKNTFPLIKEVLLSISSSD